VSEPVRNLDQRGPAPHRRERKVDALRRAAEPHLLISDHGRHRRGHLRRHLPLAHSPHETDALARRCADQALLLAAIADHAAGGIDTARKRRFGHDAAIPDGGDQVILADDPIAVADQKQEEIEDLRLDRNERALATQLAPVGIEHVIVEKEQQAAPGGSRPRGGTLTHPIRQPKRVRSSNGRIKIFSRPHQASLEARGTRR
jgi:hypothetical protein